MRRRKPRYTDEETKFLGEMFARGYGNTQISYMLVRRFGIDRERSPAALSKKRASLGYKRATRSRPFTVDEDEVLLVGTKAGWSLTKMAALLPGRTKGMLSGRLYRLRHGNSNSPLALRLRLMKRPVDEWGDPLPAPVTLPRLKWMEETHD